MGMSKSIRIKQAYKKSKNIYDDVLTQSKWWSKLYIKMFWGVSDIRLADELLCSIPNDFKGRLLDVPVGTGVFTADKYSKLQSATITVLDFSYDMLVQAKKRFKEHGITNVCFMQGDVGDLPFPDDSFDVVFSMNGFHVFPDKAKAFSETSRVLKKGGKFIGCFYIKGQNKGSDFIVNALLSKKGWFCLPFFTKEGLQAILDQNYTKVDLKTQKAMAYFVCEK